MEFADPKTNALQLGVRPGQRVADLGTGSGHYALALAHVVGAEGKVYAIDVQEDVLARLRNDAKHHKVKNIETVWGDIEKPGGTKLKDESMDAVVLSNTLFQLEDKQAAVTEVQRILKSGGKALVVDWAGAYDGLGPHADSVVPEHAAEELFIGAGFHKAKGFRGGPHHYAIVFTRP